MENIKSIAVVNIESYDWKEDAKSSKIIKTYIPFNVAKIVFNLFNEFYFDKDFENYCEQSEDYCSDSFKSYLDYKVKDYKELEEFTKEKEYDSLADFFKIHSVGTIEEIFQIEDEEVSRDKFYRSEGYSHMEEHISYLDNEGNFLISEND